MFELLWQPISCLNKRKGSMADVIGKIRVAYLTRVNK